MPQSTADANSRASRPATRHGEMTGSNSTSLEKHWAPALRYAGNTGDFLLNPFLRAPEGGDYGEISEKKGLVASKKKQRTATELDSGSSVGCVSEAQPIG